MASGLSPEAALARTTHLCVVAHQDDIDVAAGAVGSASDAAEHIDRDRRRNAVEDRPDALHYVDPPYLPELRSGGNPYCDKHRYRHELRAEDHEDLLAFLRSHA